VPDVWHSATLSAGVGVGHLLRMRRNGRLLGLRDSLLPASLSIVRHRAGDAKARYPSRGRWPTSPGPVPAGPILRKAPRARGSKELTYGIKK